MAHLSSRLQGNTILSYIQQLGNYRIILASGSPRRKELLNLMGIQKFEVIVSNFSENLDMSSFLRPQDYCMATAKEKVKAVAASLTQSTPTIVIGADTIVEVDGSILEKPADDTEAKRMMLLLSGKPHHVHTSVVIYSNIATTCTAMQEITESTSFVETSEVKFIDLAEADIIAYIASGEGRDKAGGYGIQGLGGQMVKSINGCYFNVMGLPINKLSEALAALYKTAN